MKKRNQMTKFMLGGLLSMMLLTTSACDVLDKDSPNQDLNSSFVEVNLNEEGGQGQVEPESNPEKEPTAASDNPYKVNPLQEIPYYIPDYQDRYEAYQGTHGDLTPDQIVLDVNMNLDAAFYAEGSIFSADASDQFLILCNKYSQLTQAYEPMDLVDVPNGYYVKDGKSYQLNQEALDQFIAMAKAAKADGIDLKIISAYRTYNYQKGLYDRYKNSHGQADADTFSARPGHSEHETGLAVDINQVSNSFKETDAYEWLQLHAADYGYILRYLEGQDHRTGYMYEPWHYRYVGQEVAKFIVDEGLLYDEYYAMYVLPEKYQ